MTRQVFFTVTFVIGLNLGVTAFAGHINEHHDSDDTFPIPIPGQDFFTGGAMKVLALGPIGGSVITSTTFELDRLRRTSSSFSMRPSVIVSRSGARCSTAYWIVSTRMRRCTRCSEHAGSSCWTYFMSEMP